MQVSADQVRWFRLRRSGLVDPFPTPVAVARRLLGVQAQLLPAAGLAIHNRTRRSTQAALDRARLSSRSLVRLWGQRNTLHLYRSRDWPLLHTVLAEKQTLFDGKLREAGLLSDFRRLARRTERRLEAGEELTHKDVRSPKLERSQDQWSISYVVLGKLVRDGVACHGPERGSQSTFVHRDRWLPDLRWEPPEPEPAFAELVRRYLACYGPATDADLAFWYGGTLAQARRWRALAADELATVEVDGREHHCLRRDLDELDATPPPAARWPVHLLHRFDPLLLATKDKSWLVDARHYKAVWRGSAHVAPVLLVGGRIAGNWLYERASGGLTVRLQPFGRLTRAVRDAAGARAQGIARHLGTPLAAFAVEP